MHLYFPLPIYDFYSVDCLIGYPGALLTTAEGITCSTRFKALLPLEKPTPWQAHLGKDVQMDIRLWSSQYWKCRLSMCESNPYLDYDLYFWNILHGGPDHPYL